MVVKSELEKFGLHPGTVTLGEAEIPSELSPQQKLELNERLQELGFELIDDRKTRLIEGVKTSIVELIHSTGDLPKITFSEYLSDKFHQDYSALSKLFSEVQGMTLEQYVITQKIERVKELLVYDELSLSQISLQLNYSSVSHLSKQFKKVTGLTPTHFKQVREKKRIPLDKI
ncbi:helix-turn-helix domain-containing protein [Salinimicrobium soli]|uniref:helix-turn-helix domain-containing protein n=1 Tax=Salinimicrobium soli TaxID=1254399 RepID=UPI003AAACBEA